MDERALADRLDRFLDSLTTGETSGGEVDPDLAEIARRYHALGQSPAPAGARYRVQRRILPTRQSVPNGREARLDGVLSAPTYANRRREDLMDAASPPLMLGSSRNGGTPTQLLQPIAPPISRLTRGSTMLTRVAATIVLIVVVTSAVVALLYALRLSEGDERLFVAGSDTPTVETTLTGETTLLDLTLTDMPTYRAQLGMYIVTLPPGTKTEQHSGAGPQLFFVADGSVTVRAGTAPEPLEVIPPGRPGAPPSKTLVAQGEQATMETGATLLAPAGAVFDLFTTGPAAASVVDLLAAADSRGLGDGITVQFASNGGMVVDLAAPVSIVLRQGSLAPEETLPAPASDATRQVVAPPEAAAMGDLRSGTGGTVRNAGQQPVDLYVLTVTTGDGSA